MREGMEEEKLMPKIDLLKTSFLLTVKYLKIAISQKNGRTSSMFYYGRCVVWEH
jgi:hypothetical protein